MSKFLNARLNEALNNGSLLQIADDCLSVKEVLAKLGYSAKGQYIQIVKQYLVDNEVDISHFTYNGKPKTDRYVTKNCINCHNPFTTEHREIREQVTCSRACSNTYFRSGVNNGNWKGGINYRKVAFDNYIPKCNRCNYDDVRALEVHHKDRNRENNSLENLEILCCNCHTIEHRTE